MLKYTSSGLSINQIKQDAKRLSKENEISKTKALNQIVSRDTGFESWDKMTHYMSKQPSINDVIKFVDKEEEVFRLKIYKNKPLNIILAPNEMSKIDFLTQLVLENKKNFLYSDQNVSSDELLYKLDNVLLHEYSRKKLNKRVKSTVEYPNEINNLIKNIKKSKTINTLVIDGMEWISDETYIDELKVLIESCIEKDITIFCCIQSETSFLYTQLKKYKSNHISLKDIVFDSEKDRSLSDLKIENKLINEVVITSIKLKD